MPQEPGPMAPFTFTAPQNPDNFLNGIQESASLPAEAAPPATPSAAPMPQIQSTPAAPVNDSSTPKIPLQPASQQIPPQTQPEVSSGPPPTAPPLPPPTPENSTRNLVILTSFDSLPPNSKHLNSYAFFSNNRKTPKPSKHAPELCTITSLPARYRDPSTGLGYANAYAYQKLQELTKQNYVWSGMLGCYVGKVGVAARGVPDGFLG